MCDVCYSIPCRSGCPNAPETTEIICKRCDSELDENYAYFEDANQIACSECIKAYLDETVDEDILISYLDEKVASWKEEIGKYAADDLYSELFVFEGAVTRDWYYDRMKWFIFEDTSHFADWYCKKGLIVYKTIELETYENYNNLPASERCSKNA